MLATPTSVSHRVSQPKHKAACDQCTASKVKCPGGGPRCKRCADSSQPCHYSLARRYGKPPGSKNRKTLERLRQAKERTLETDSTGKSGWSLPQSIGSRDDGDGAMDGGNKRWEGDDSLDRIQTLSTTSLWPISPLIDYPACPGASQSILSPEEDFLDCHHDLPLDAGDRSFQPSTDPASPNVEGLGRAEPRRMWADDADEFEDSSPSSVDQPLSSSPANTDSPPFQYPRSSASQTHQPISLDIVAARLEDATGSTVAHFEQRQPVPCRCLRKYSNVLCKLQIIEKRQRPVQADTFLTWANLVLNTVENRLDCPQCLYDSCVAMQLLLIFQTIFGWSRDQCRSPNASAPALRVTLGEHEMTEDESRFVGTALVDKVIYRIITLLRYLKSRFHHVPLDRREEWSWDDEGAKFGNVPQLIGSLVKGFDGLTDKTCVEAVKQPIGIL